jgi:Holliday junction resolvasome RuvABC endonuclease subunit
MDGTTMKVVGIDPSITATGLCTWDGSASTVKTNPKQKDNRLRVIRSAVKDVATVSARDSWGRDVPVDLAVVELPLTHGPGSIAMATLHMVQAVVRMVLMDAGVPYVLVNNSWPKGYATGNGKADKAAMARAAYDLAGVRLADDNQVDAWWMRQMALDHYGYAPLNSTRIPAAQRAWLDKVAWPELEEL